MASPEKFSPRDRGVGALAGRHGPPGAGGRCPGMNAEGSQPSTFLVCPGRHVIGSNAAGEDRPGREGRRAEVPREERARRASCSRASASRLLVDEGSFVEDAALANDARPRAARRRRDHRASGQVDGRTVAIMANDSTVKAGSWGARTVEKILRIQETAQAPAAARSSTWSTRPARASPIRSRCSPAAAARGASSTTRCTLSGAGARRSACSSGRRRRAARTSRRSATSS